MVMRKLNEALRPLFYVATPYTNYQLGREKAYKDACTAAEGILKVGEAVYCPIAHYHSIVSDVDAKTGAYWQKVNAPFMDAATLLIIVKMDGWAESAGIRAEERYFREAGKPILHISIADALEFDKFIARNTFEGS
jgi:hypothetical protein